MLTLANITLRIAGRPLLEGADLQIAAGQKVGLVGRNGTGKTSLFRLVLGELQPDEGELLLPTGWRIGSVAQDAPGGSRTPLDAVLAADLERQALIDERGRGPSAERLADIEMRLYEIGAEAAPARAARILKGLGFDEAMQARPLASFSGGWRMRVALAATLFAEPDLLLLDEPTNHLDLEAALWLEAYLKRYPRTLVLISHDRDLLNSIPDRIVHLEARQLKAYSGNYDAFDRIRREQRELLEKQRKSLDARRKHLQSFVDRFRYKASKATQAQSRIKMLEKLGTIAPPPPEPDVVFHFPAPEMPPPPLITLDDAAVGYGGAPVLRGLDLRLDPDDRIALLGANGNGKSTLAKLLSGRLEPMLGELHRSRGLRVGFFAQHQTEDLEPGDTALQHLQRLLPNERAERLRALLGRFGLTQARAETKAQHLSGGEKTRLCLALVATLKPQLLILDEPSNHLDIDSREALIEAINEFPGAVVLISHDRHLVELTADRLWLVKDGRVRVYDGDLESYRAELLARAEGDGQSQKGRPAKTVGGSERRQLLAPLRKAAKDLEAEIRRLETDRARLERRLADPATYRGEADIATLESERQGVVAAIARAEERWLEIEGEIEAVG
ncbi:MAG: ABC-F family ATP-binding cassette domain-containing protein [Geminicoccaceae bacterium]